MTGDRVAAAALYEAERRQLLGVAYRLLGTMTDAEDVLQDVFERWLRVDRSVVENPAAYLTTMTTRAALDRLRSARSTREVYTGPWLPEPVISDEHDGPAAVAELDESLTIGYLHLMEQLTPYERAAHLLHDVYQFPYREIATMLDKDEVNCRQLASRARAKLRASRPDRGEARAPDVDAGIAERLVEAVLGGDIEQVMELFADDIVHLSDGGAQQHAARRPVVGADRVARLFVNLGRRLGDLEGEASFHHVTVNLQPAIVMSLDDRPFLVVVIDVVDGLISRLYAVLNPDKLAGLQM